MPLATPTTWNSSTLATSCKELAHWKRPWCWEGLGAGGEGVDRGWDGWMASPTRWAWVWVNSGSWWWTGRPGVPRFTGSQRVGYNWATELNWAKLKEAVEVDITQADWHLYMTQKDTQGCAQREKAPWGGKVAVCKPGRGLGRNQACWHLDLRCLGSKLWENRFLLFRPPSFWYVVMTVIEKYSTLHIKPRH